MKPVSLLKVATWLAAVWALALGSGCAAANRATYVREQAAKHIYERPMAEVWTAAKQLLIEEGYSGREGKGAWSYVTEWKENSAGSHVSGTHSRYSLEGKELAPDRCVVRYWQVARSAGASGAGIADPSSTHSGMAAVSPGMDGARPLPTGAPEGIGPQSTLASGKRDLEMEWKLLQKVDPLKARAIEEQARREYPDD